MLDEVLWGTDPARADTDGDGVNDGADCHPRDRARSFTITGKREYCLHHSVTI